MPKALYETKWWLYLEFILSVPLIFYSSNYYTYFCFYRLKNLIFVHKLFYKILDLINNQWITTMEKMNRFMVIIDIYPTTAEGNCHRGEENPATNLGPTEEGADHLLGLTEKAVQKLQRQDEGSEWCSDKSSPATLNIMISIMWRSSKIYNVY